MSEDSEVVRLAARRIGTVLRGKYRIDRVLGVGGMAVVYAATHRNKRAFAVKMLRPELSINADIRTRFLREGYVANSVEHPGAVAVLDDDVAEDGAAFLVMELLDGAGVDKLWQKGGNRLSVRVVLALGYQLLDVLAAAHAKSVVHRDIKPANIFLTRDGALKVLDFGIARLRDATSAQATQTGQLMGTPAFMAPEHAIGKSSEVDGLTDVWAVGATMFSLLSGSTVHLGDNPQMLMVQAATQPARSVASVVADLPAAVVALVDRALAFDRALRWKGAAAMRDGVRETYEALYLSALSPASLVELFAPGDGRRLDSLVAHAGAPAPVTESVAMRSPLTHPSEGAAAISHSTETAAAPVPAALLRIDQGRMIGSTTSRPISADQRGGNSFKSRLSTARIAAPAAVVVGLLAVAAVLAARFGSETPRATPQSPSASSILPVASVATAVATLAPAALSTEESAPSTAPDATPILPRPLATSGANAPAAARASSVPVSSPPAWKGGAAASPAAPTVHVKVDCDPPYVIDAAGHRQYKRECLK